mgnify:CR=1 FL=1
MSHPPQWHLDPQGLYDLRYWDGQQWTSWVCDRGGEPFNDTPPSPPPPTPFSAHIATRNPTDIPPPTANVKPAPAPRNPADIPPPTATPAPQRPADIPPPTANVEPAAARPQDTLVPNVLEWDKAALNRLDNDASRFTKDLEAQYRYLADLVQHSDRDLRQEFQSYADGERRQLLDSMPIERLKEFTDKSLKITPLQRAGFDFVGAVAFGTTGLELIPGIGTVGAASLRLAIAAARKWSQDQVVTMPRPDQLRLDRTGLLRAAARELRSKEVPPGLVPQLETTLEALRDQLDVLRQERRGRSGLRRLFGRSVSEEQVQLTAQDLHEEIYSPALLDLARRAAAVITETTVPNTFDELLREYTGKFADYSSILEQVVSEIGGAGDAMVEKARGGLPASVAARIEALPLHTMGLNVHLRGYQEFGIQFMIEQARTVLGDEMGLGKTIQALGAMAHVKNTEEASRFIVIAPASILANWEREIERRSDFQTHVLHGAQREALMARWLKSGGVALTSYATLRSLPRLEDIAVDMLVADEAHYVKNPGSQRSRAVERLSRHAKRIILMTGTPLENRVDEFQNLIAIANPGFLRELSVGASTSSRHGFRAAVAPIYLRRNQEDVLKELPERIELEEWVSLGSAERQAHAAAVGERNMMGMRQAAIFGGGPESAKLQRLQELLEHYAADGQKVLVFSYFLGALDAVQSVTTGCFRVDGSVSSASRQDEVDRFGNVDGHAVLAAQITAGGVGLNIQAASVVVLMEPQFKPTTEWQAIARAHRMGQTRRVTVHRLIARDCIDESLHQLVAAKTKIFDDYARESMLKEATAASTDLVDGGLMNQLLQMEADRLQLSTSGVRD